MILLDVNVLIYAHRRDVPDHEAFREWLESVASSEIAFGVSDLVSSAFLRIVTNSKIFDPPTPMEAALQVVEDLRTRPNCVVVSPGPRHWEIFADLCRSAQIRGPVVTDAYFAALAIESGSEWLTVDRGFARFPGLRWRHPLSG